MGLNVLYFDALKRHEPTKVKQNLNGYILTKTKTDTSIKSKDFTLWTMNTTF